MTVTEHVGTLTPDVVAQRAELIARARALQPLLRKNAARADAERRIPQESIDAVVQSAVFDVWTPRRYGGHEADMRTQMEILTELARGCSATSWVGSLYTGCAHVMAGLPDEAQDEVWGAGPSALTCGILTPAGRGLQVRGGYRVSGSWPWASGCHHARWAMLATPLVDGDGRVTNVGFCLVPMSELHIQDTWYTLGMRGTGSDTLIGEDLFVPEHRVLPLLDEKGQMNPASRSSFPRSPLSKVPYGSLASLWMIGVPLGIAREALDLALEQLPSRGIAYSSYTAQIESATTQYEMADAATRIDTAVLHSRRAADDADRIVNHGETLDMVTRGRIRQDIGYAARMCREGVDLLMQQCGASSIADASPLQRAFRDVSTCTLHAFVRPALMAEVYGRTLLGLEPSITVC